MKTVCTLIAISVVLCSFAFAATSPDANAQSKDTILQEVKGQGPTKDEAIRNGLFQAVAQARGVKVGSGRYSYGYSGASADIDRTPTGKSVEFDAVNVQTAGTLNTTEIAGLVKTYEVIDEKKLDDGNYQVTLKAWVYDHKPLDKSARVRVAVMPLRTNYGSYIFGGLTMRAEQLSERMEQKLTTALSQTNKFAVLDRQHIAEYFHEQKLLANTATIEEQAKIGQTLGADYMLVGTITDAGLRIKHSGTEAIAGVTYTEYEADFAIDYRLIVASSRQIKFSDTVRLHLDTPGIKKLVRKWEPSDLNYDEITDNLIAKIAAEVINQLSDRLYPPRIAAIQSDGSIIIDQGGDRLVTGTVLEVVKPGQQITDSDTKEVLGSTETLVATIKIDKVAPAMSYCSVVSGDASQLSQGLVCRIKSLPGQEVGGAKSQLEKTPQGGVKLPFD